MLCFQTLGSKLRERERERESKRLRRFVKFLFSFLFFVSFFFTVNSSVYATNTLQDQFTTDRAVGAVNGTATEPGPGGNRTITDTGSKIAIGSGQLLMDAGSSHFNDPMITWSGLSAGRQIGRVFMFDLDVSNPAAGQRNFGWVKTPISDTFGIWGPALRLSAASSILIWTNSGNNTTAAGLTFTPGVYSFAIVQDNPGAKYFVKGGIYTDWTLFWVSTSGSENVLPALNSYSAELKADNTVVTDLTGSWATSTGLATVNVTSPTANYTDIMPADAWVEETWTPATNDVFELSVRRTDDNNRWILRADQAAGTVKLIQKQAGVETERATSNVTLSAGTAYRMTFSTYGTMFAGYVANANKFTYNGTGSTFNQTATGVKTNLAGSNLRVWPAGSNNEYSTLNSYQITSEQSTATLATNISAYWRLDELAGVSGYGIREDSVGSSHLTPNGTLDRTATAGKIGKAPWFVNTEGDYLNVADNAALSVSAANSFTIAAWVDMQSKVSQTFVSKGYNRTTPGSMEYALDYDSGVDRFRFLVSDGSTLVTLQADKLGAPSASNWYLLVGKYDSSTGKIYLKVNNGLVDSATSAGAWDGTNEFRIGGVASYYANAYVDEVGLWKKATTDLEDRTLWNTGTGIQYPFDSTPLVVFDGDSLTRGYGLNITTDSYPYQLRSSLSGYTYDVEGANGESLSTMLANAPTNIDPLYNSRRTKNIVVIWGGINDFIWDSKTAAQVYADTVSYGQARRAAGWKVVVVTTLPTGNASAPADYETKRTTLNANILANWNTFADAIADPGADATIGQTSSPNNTSYYQSDKTHLTAVGATIVANLVKAAIQSPIISSVSPGSPISTGTTITWTTNTYSSSKIDYGLTNSYGSSTTETDTSPYVKSHSVAISSLVACSTYHYRTRSKDAMGNETIDTDNTFTTSGCTASSVATATASAQITTAAGGTLTLLDSNSHGLTLNVPISFAGSDANFQAHQLDKTTVLTTTSTPAGYSAAGGYFYELKALTDISTTISTFNNALTANIAYGASDISGLDESTLKIYRWDGSIWNQLTGCVVSTAAKTVTCTTTNFSVFGLFGQVPATTTSSSSSNSNSSTSTTACNDQTPGTKAPWLYGAIAQDSGSVLLYFTEADNPVNKYVLEYGTQSGNYPYGVQDMGVNSRGQMTFLVKSLSPNTTYYFKVRGGNGCATGSWSNEISATTKGLVSFNQLDITQSQLETQPVAEIPSNTSCQTYTVKFGDTLWSIAKNLLGDGNKYKEIVNQNKDTYSSLETSNDLRSGWELKINCGKQTTTEETKKPTETQGGYDVKVKVVDTNKNPVEGVTVTLHSTPQTTTTDKNGVAAFKNVEAGDHKVLIAYNNFEGEQSINLTGNVKEFDLNVIVQQKAISLSPLAYGIIGVMGLAILGLIVLLIKNKSKG